MTDFDIYNPKCSICEKKAKKRKLFLLVRNLSNMAREDACICELCFFRLPDSILKQLSQNSNNMSGLEYNTMIINALRHTTTRLDLTIGYSFLVETDTFDHFEKYEGWDEFVKATREHKKMGHKILNAWENGKIFSITS